MNPGDRKALVIVRRSRKNLDFIYEQKSLGADVEEFTQLLNSMLGMLICLREEYFRGHEVTWQEVEGSRLQRLYNESDESNDEFPKLKAITTFSQLISKLRNAFAHNCFELLGSPTITGVRVWNVPDGDKNIPRKRTWQAKLSEQQLRDVAILLVDFLEKKHGHELGQDKT